MPLPDERPRQSVANLIGKFEHSGKRGSGSNGAGVARRQSQGVLGSTAPAMPLKAQYTGQSTSAISVQSGPRSPPIKASELTSTTGTDVPSWRKTTLPQATVPPAPEIPEAESTLEAGTELQETNPPSITEQQITSDEPAAIPVPTETEEVIAPNEPTTPRPPEKSTRATKTTSNKPKVASSNVTKSASSGPSKTTKPPPSSRPSTLSKATVSGAAKSSRPSAVPPPPAPLKPQVTGGSAIASRLSAPTASSKARIASAVAASSSTTKPNLSDSTVRLETASMDDITAALTIANLTLDHELERRLARTGAAQTTAIDLSSIPSYILALVQGATGCRQLLDLELAPFQYRIARKYPNLSTSSRASEEAFEEMAIHALCSWSSALHRCHFVAIHRPLIAVIRRFLSIYSATEGLTSVVVTMDEGRWSTGLNATSESTLKEDQGAKVEVLSMQHLPNSFPCAIAAVIVDTTGWNSHSSDVVQWLRSQDVRFICAVSHIVESCALNPIRLLQLLEPNLHLLDQELSPSSLGGDKVLQDWLNSHTLEL